MGIATLWEGCTVATHPLEVQRNSLAPCSHPQAHQDKRKCQPKQRLSKTSRYWGNGNLSWSLTSLPVTILHFYIDSKHLWLRLKMSWDKRKTIWKVSPCFKGLILLLICCDWSRSTIWNTMWKFVCVTKFYTYEAFISSTRTRRNKLLIFQDGSDFSTAGSGVNFVPEEPFNSNDLPSHKHTLFSS